jgi:hypothetical protein
MREGFEYPHEVKARETLGVDARGHRAPRASGALETTVFAMPPKHHPIPVVATVGADTGRPTSFVRPRGVS